MRLDKLVGTEIIDDDIRLGHTYYEVDVLRQFIKELRPQWFVEIGIHEGGLSYCLIPGFYGVCKYFGVEINCTILRPYIRCLYDVMEYATLWCGDAFDEGLFKKISELPNKVIYCDNGDKPKELLFYRDACNSGDLLMCHDYSDGIRRVKGIPNYFHREFPCPEVLSRDIAELDGDNSFIRLPERIFKKTRIVGWEKR